MLIIHFLFHFRFPLPVPWRCRTMSAVSYLGRACRKCNGSRWISFVVATQAYCLVKGWFPSISGFRRRIGFPERVRYGLKAHLVANLYLGKVAKAHPPLPRVPECQRKKCLGVIWTPPPLGHGRVKLRCACQICISKHWLSDRVKQNLLGQ